MLLRGRDAPIMTGLVAVSTQGALIALAEVEQGELRPRRIFNLTDHRTTAHVTAVASAPFPGAPAEILADFCDALAERCP